MAKLRTTEKINWGGSNPFINNFIEIEMKELSVTNEVAKYLITDTVIGERIDNEIISEFKLIEIRRKVVDITPEVYAQMYTSSDVYIDANYPNISRIEREILRPKVALFLYFINDKIDDGSGNEVCLYNTQPSQWQIIE